MTAKLDPQKISHWLETQPQWRLDQEKLHREFQFSDFRAAFGWMTQIALLAEKKDHHPEWLNVYSKVQVWLTTHDCSGISEKDLWLAEQMEQAYALVRSPE